MEILQMSDKYLEYQKDESKFCGNGTSISFPKTCEEACEILSEMKKNDEVVTPQGAKTGLVGGGVAVNSHTMNFEKMNKIISTEKVDGDYIVKIESGVTLSQLREHIKTINDNVDFVPNPTEETATFGGLYSHNAKGMNCIKYGGISKHVVGVKVLFSNGEVVNIHRGEYSVKDCKLNFLGRELDFGANERNNGKDLIDIIAGSEGQFGIVLELYLKLTKLPTNRWGVMFFFEKKDNLIEFKNYVNNLLQENESVDLSVFEYYDKLALKIVSEWKKTSSKLKSIPDFAKDYQTAIYIEIEGEIEEEIEVALVEMLDKFEALGGAESDTWAGVLPTELEKFQHFRHAVQEGANSEIQKAKNVDGEIYKLSMDFYLIDSVLEKVVSQKIEILNNSGLEYLFFGHIGENHLQLNLLPKNGDEFQKAKTVMVEICEYNFKNGGVNFIENGVGKTRTECVNAECNNFFKGMKDFFDSENILNINSLKK